MRRLIALTDPGDSFGFCSGIDPPQINPYAQKDHKKFGSRSHSDSSSLDRIEGNPRSSSKAIDKWQIDRLKIKQQRAKAEAVASKANRFYGCPSTLAESVSISLGSHRNASLREVSDAPSRLIAVDFGSFPKISWVISVLFRTLSNRLARIWTGLNPLTQNWLWNLDLRPTHKGRIACCLVWG